MATFQKKTSEIFWEIVRHGPGYRPIDSHGMREAQRDVAVALFSVVPKDPDNPDWAWLSAVIKPREAGVDQKNEPIPSPNEILQIYTRLIGVIDLAALTGLCERYQREIKANGYEPLALSPKTEESNSLSPDPELVRWRSTARILLNQVHELTIAAGERERIRSKLAWLAVIRPAIITTAALCLLWLALCLPHLVHPAVIGAMGSGLFGSALSGVIRIQKSNNIGISQADLNRFAASKASVLTSITLGAPFGLLLVLLLGSGLTEKVFNPEVVPPITIKLFTYCPTGRASLYPWERFQGYRWVDIVNPDEARCNPAEEARKAEPWEGKPGEDKEGRDRRAYLSLFLFAFLAGWSERFVPDTLNRLEQAAVKASETIEKQ